MAAREQKQQLKMTAGWGNPSAKRSHRRPSRVWRRSCELTHTPLADVCGTACIMRATRCRWLHVADLTPLGGRETTLLIAGCCGVAIWNGALLLKPVKGWRESRSRMCEVVQINSVSVRLYGDRRGVELVCCTYYYPVYQDPCKYMLWSEAIVKIRNNSCLFTCQMFHNVWLYLPQDCVHCTGAQIRPPEVHNH